MNQLAKGVLGFTVALVVVSFVLKVFLAPIEFDCEITSIGDGIEEERCKLTLPTHKPIEYVWFDD